MRERINPAAPPLRLRSALELGEWVGRELPPGVWTSVTQDDVARFVALTGDGNRIHAADATGSDEPGARRPVVPGQLLLALIPGLLQALYTVEAGYGVVAGLRAVRFRIPVHPGDEFRLRARILRVRQHPVFVQVETDCLLELANGRRAVTSQRSDLFYPD